MTLLEFFETVYRPIVTRSLHAGTWQLYRGAIREMTIYLERAAELADLTTQNLANLKQHWKARGICDTTVGRRLGLPLRHQTVLLHLLKIRSWTGH